MAAEGIIKAELWSSRGEQGAMQVDSNVVRNKSTTETVLWKGARVKTSGGIESKLVEETEKRLCLQDAQTIGSRLECTV